MPETEEKIKETVDIDTSGPEVEIKLPEEKIKEEDKTYEDERETKLEDGGVANDTPEKPVEQPAVQGSDKQESNSCLLYTSPSPRDGLLSRMPSSA